MTDVTDDEQPNKRPRLGEGNVTGSTLCHVDTSDDGWKKELDARRVRQQEEIKSRGKNLEASLVQVGVLGTGVFGQVLKMTLGQHAFAVKKIRRELPATLAREVQVFSLLRHHPNIVCYYESFYADKEFWILMEVIEGKSLEERIEEARAHPIPPAEARSILVQLLDALIHVHGQAIPILHRDIKPANVLLDSRGHVFLADFGLARHATVSISSQFRGTPLYASPEKLNGGIDAEVTVKDDIWAFGCIALELLGGTLLKYLVPSETAGGSQNLADRTLHALETLLDQTMGDEAIVSVMCRLASMCLCFYQELRPSAAQGKDWLQGSHNCPQLRSLEFKASMARCGRKLQIMNLEPGVETHKDLLLACLLSQAGEMVLTNRLDNTKAASLAEFVHQCTDLQTLSLCDSRINVHDTRHLSQVVCSPNSEEVQVYWKLISANTALTSLDIRHPQDSPLHLLLDDLSTMDRLRTMVLGLELDASEHGRGWCQHDTASLFGAISSLSRLTFLSLGFLNTKAVDASMDPEASWSSWYFNPNNFSQQSEASYMPLIPGLAAALTISLASMSSLTALHLSLLDKGGSVFPVVDEAGAHVLGNYITECMSQLCQLRLGHSPFPLELIRAADDLQLPSKQNSICLDNPENTVVFARLVECSSALTSLNLRGHALRERGASILFKALSSLRHRPCLRVLDLKFVSMREAGAEGLVEVLHAHTKMERLEIGSNFITAAGATRLAAALCRLPYLSSLGLANNELFSDGVVAVCDAVTSTTLIELDLSGNKAEPGSALEALARLVGRSPALRRLDLSKNLLVSELDEFDDDTNSVHVLLDTIEASSNLEALLMESTLLMDSRLLPCEPISVWGDLGKETCLISRLTRAVGACLHLRELDLRNETLTVYAAMEIADAVAGLTHLTSLRLGSASPLSVPELTAGEELLLNSCSAVEVAAAGRLARGNTRLRALKMIRTGHVRDAVKLIEPVLRGAGTNLTSVRLSQADLDDLGAAALATALAGAAGLVELCLPWSYIGPQGAAEVARILGGCPRLAALDLAQCNVTGVVKLGSCCFAVLVPRDSPCALLWSSSPAHPLLFPPLPPPSHALGE